MAGGDTVVLTGQNFWPNTGVIFGGTTLQNTDFSVISDTQITLTTLSGMAGSVDIQLTHPVVQNIAAYQNGYTYTEIGAPQIAVQGGGGTEIPFGGFLTLEVTNTADFTSPQYQWYRNDTVISGATGNTYIATEAGSYKVKVTDGLEEKESAAITLTEGGAPTLSLQPIGNKSVEEEQHIEIQIQANHSGGLPLGYSVSNLPLGLSVDQDGLISGTPQTGTAGDYDVQVKVTAGALTEAGSFRLTVREKGAGPGDPKLELDPIADATAKINEPFTMTLGYSYSGSGTLSWSADSLPPGLSIGSGGVISGTPTRDGPFMVTVDVTDGTLHDSGGFLLTVEKEGGGGTDPGPGPDPGGNSNGGSTGRGSGSGDSYSGSSYSSSGSGAVTEITFDGMPTGPVNVGYCFTLVPSIDTGVGSAGWEWDEEFFSATFNSPATFTALKPGTSTIKYSTWTGNVAGSLEVTILGAEQAVNQTAEAGNPTHNPNTGGGGNLTAWILLMLGSLSGAAVLCRRKLFPMR